MRHNFLLLCSFDVTGKISPDCQFLLCSMNNKFSRLYFIEKMGGKLVN